jgi:hypothetical protein
MEGADPTQIEEQPTQFSQEAQDFEPSSAQQFLSLKDGSYQRLIFTEIDLREKEETHLEQFREYCTQNQITIPEGYDDDNRFLLRILQGKKWKYDAAAAAVIEHNEWKVANMPLQFEPLKDMLNKGVIYGAGRDMQFRPVIIVNCVKILENAVSEFVYKFNFLNYRKKSTCWLEQQTTT